MGLAGKIPKFVSDLITAFTVSALIYAVPYWVVYLNAAGKGYDHYLNYFAVFLNGLRGWTVSLVAIAIAMFLIAYPIETFLVRQKRQSKPLQAAVTFLLTMFAAAVICIILGFLLRGQMLALYVATVFFIVGGIVAFFARLLYPHAKKVPSLVTITCAVFALGAILGVVIPNQSIHGTDAMSFVPDRRPGELSRAVLIQGESPSTDAMKNFSSNQPSVNGKKYDLVFGCRKNFMVSRRYLVKVFDEQGNVLKQEKFGCYLGNGDTFTVGQIDLGSKPTRVKVRLTPLGGGPISAVPLAFASVSPAGLPW